MASNVSSDTSVINSSLSPVNCSINIKELTKHRSRKSSSSSIESLESIKSTEDSIESSISVKSTEPSESINSSKHESCETDAAHNDQTCSSEADNESSKIYVTQDIYERKIDEIVKIKGKIKQNEVLLKLSSVLPDGGAKIKYLIAELKEELKRQEDDLANMKVKETSENDLIATLHNITLNDEPKPEWNKKWTHLLNDVSKEGGPVSILDFLRSLDVPLSTCPDEKVLIEQSTLLNVALMPHQRYALAWMTWRESQFPRGGILGDDMGLGKTLSMIALIVQQLELRDIDSSINKNAEKICGRTLIICPASLLQQWELEFQKFLNTDIGVVVHHGDNRCSNPMVLTSYEVVITTYGIIRKDFEKAGPLSNIHWERIILDEAHAIKNHTSKQSVECCRLSGSIKWAITGTPIQNKEQDVYALIRFIGCHPLNDNAVFKRFCGKNPQKAQERLALIMRLLLLRRTKQELMAKADTISFPEKKTEFISVQLDDDEMSVYHMVLTFVRNLCRKFTIGNVNEENCNLNQLTTQNAKRNFCFVLLSILRLRQICIHPNLIHDILEEDLADDDLNSIKSNVLNEFQKLKIDEDNAHASNLLCRSNPVYDSNRLSSKFKTILSLIEEKVIKTQEKAIIVSQFVSVLELMEKHLKNRNIPYLVLTGSTKISNRANIVNSFNNENGEKILLLSLMAGGVGLNLCGGNHLIFLDPHWNPQVELQAEDRIYRIGQKKPVTIYKLICQGTIEERIKELQEKKKGVANRILNGSDRNNGFKLTTKDLLNLVNLNM